MKCSLGISNFLEEISSVSHSIVFLYFFALIAEEGFLIPGKFGLGIQHEAGQRLIEFCQENPLVIANTLFQQHKSRLYTWTSADGQYCNQTDLFSAAKDGKALYSQQKQDLELTVDHELLIAKFRLKLKKVGKTTRPFRYDLNQIPYDYIVEVTNRFKGLDLVDKVPKELWTEACTYRRQ